MSTFRRKKTLEAEAPAAAPAKTSRFGRKKSAATADADGTDEEDQGASAQLSKTPSKSTRSLKATPSKSKALAVRRESASVHVAIKAIELPDSKAANALVEVNMLGVEKKPSRSKHAALIRGRATLDWEKAYEAAAGTDLRKAISAAFRSEKADDDSEIHFKVFASEGAKDTQVGTAVLSLEGMLDKLKDHDDELPIRNDKDKEVGRLSCAVAALELLQEIDEETDESNMIRFEVSQLELEPDARPKKGASAPVRLTVELPGADKIVSASATPSAEGEVALDFDAAFPVVKGSALATKLQHALRAGDGTLEGRAHVVLETAPAKEKGSGTLLGDAYVSLPDLLEVGRDTKRARLVLRKPVKAGALSRSTKKLDTDGPKVATASLSVTALAILGELDRLAAAPAGVPAAAPTAAPVPASPAAPERSTSRRAARGATPAADAAIELSIASLVLAREAPVRQLINAKRIRSVWVAAAAPGDARAPTTPPSHETARVRLDDDGRCTFDDRATLALASGGALRTSLARALRDDAGTAAGAARGDSVLTLTLKGAERGGEEHTLGSVAYDLLDLLDQDARDAPLRLRSGKEDVGTLTCSIVGSAALLALEQEVLAPAPTPAPSASASAASASASAVAAAAQWGEAEGATTGGGSRRHRRGGASADALDVTVTALELLADHYVTAQVEIDMLGVDPAKTAPTALAAGRAAFEWKKTYEAGAGTELRKAIAAAFRSEGKDDDSEIEFVVHATERGGREYEVGAAVLSLERDLLERGKDLALGPLPILNDKKKEVGKLTCAVTALLLLQAVDGEMDEPPAVGASATTPQPASRREGREAAAAAAAPGRRGAEGKTAEARGAARRGDASGAGARAPLEVRVGRMALTSAAKLGRKETLKLSIDVLGAETLKSKPLEPKKHEVDFHFDKELPVEAGSKLADALEDVLHGASDEASTVAFTVLVCSKAGEELRELGTLNYSLDGVLDAGRDPADEKPRTMQSKDGFSEVAKLAVSVKAFKALEELERAADGAPARRGRGAAGGRGGGGGARRGGGGAHRESVLVKLGSVQMASGFKFERKAESLAVEVDMLGSEKKPLRATAPLRAGGAALEWEKTYEAGAGTELRKAIAAAFRSDDTDDGEIQFFVHALDKAGREEELGMAALSLERDLLERGKDFALGPLPIKNDKKKEVGKLTCAVTALELLQEIDGGEAPAEISIEITQLRLGAGALKPHKLSARATVAVEVDMLGVDALTERTKKAAPSAQGACALAFKRAYDASPGSPLQSAVLRALRSEGADDDSEVLFVVFALDGEREVEVGEAALSLEALLEKGKDHALGALPVLRKGVEVGKLTVGVRALAALRAIDAQAEAGAPLAVRVGELTLDRSEAREAFVEVDVLGADERTTAAQLPRGARCDFDWRHEYATGRGAPLHEPLLAALRGDGEEPDIIFRAYQADASGRRGAAPELLGTAKVDLDAMLKRGAELTNSRLELRDARGVRAGSLVVSVTALVALREADDEVAAGERISVKLTRLELTSKDAKARLRRAGGLGVLVDVLGAAEDTVTAAPRQLTAGAATLDFAKEYSVAAGSALRRAVEQAFRSDAEADSEVQFIVQLEDGAGKRADVGIAAVSLERLLKSGRDQPLGPLPVLEMAGGAAAARALELGTLTAEVRALPALRAIDAALKAPRAAKHTGAQLALSKRAREREAAAAAARRKVTLKIGEVALSGRVARRPPDAVHVAIEFLAAQFEQRTHALSPSAGRLAFNVTQEWDLQVGGAMRDAVMDALQSDQLSASLVHLSLFGSDGRAGPTQDRYMGGARFSLRDILTSGRDLADARLEVRTEPVAGEQRPWEADAERTIATISVSVTALAALKEVADALAKYGSPADAKIGELTEQQVAQAAAAADDPSRPGAAGPGAPVEEAPPWATSHPDDALVVRMRQLTLERGAKEAIARLQRTRKATIESVTLELDLLGIADAKKQEQILTPPLAVYGDNSVEPLEYERSFSTAPGTKARSKLMAALESAETQDSDVYFVLHALARPLHASRAATGSRGTRDAQHAERVELASGFVNLEELLHQTRKDMRDAELVLGGADPDGDGRKAAEGAVARLRVDVQAIGAMNRIQEELQATRLRITPHKVQLAREVLRQFRGDALQVGVEMLGLKEQRSAIVDVYDDETTYEFKGFAFALQTHPGAEGRAALMEKLRSTPAAEQRATITLYGIDLEKRDKGRKDDTEVLGALEVALPELRRGHEPKRDKRALDPAGAGARDKRGGLTSSGPGHVWLSINAADALHWLGVEGRAADAGGRRGYRGKQEGQEGVWVDGRRVEASQNVKKGFSALRGSLQRGVDDFAQALGALPDSYAPSLLAARQQLGLSTLAVALAKQLPSVPPYARSPHFQPAEPVVALAPSAQPSFAIELGDVLNAPAPPSPQHPVARRTVRVCVVEHEPRHDGAPKPAAAVSAAADAAAAARYAFRGNALSLPVDYDERDNIWRIDAASRLLLLRTPTPPPAHAVLLVELVLTMALRPSDEATGAPQAAPAAPATLVCGWAAMPLATPLANAAAAMGGGARLPAPTPLRLSGGTLFQPKPLHAIGGAGRAAADLANPPSIPAAVVPLPPEFRTASALLPSDVLAPVDYTPLLIGGRQLCLEYETHQSGGAGAGAALGPAEVQVALSGFALLAETPDTLRTLHQVWAARRDAWGAATRGSRRGAEPSPVELATMLADVVRTAHLLGRGASFSLPPYDSADPSHAEVRLIALARFADRTSHDPLAMLCEDDPFLSYAPMRTIDLVVDD